MVRMYVRSWSGLAGQLVFDLICSAYLPPMYVAAKAPATRAAVSGGSRSQGELWLIATRKAKAAPSNDPIDEITTAQLCFM